MIIEVEKAVKQFHEDCKSLGETLMKDHNNVPMTVALLTQDKEKGFATGVAPDIGFMYDPDNKQVFVDTMRLMISTLKPIAIGFISEAWMVKRSIEEGYDYDKPVREQEDRVEILMVQIETYKYSSLTIYDMIRDGDQVKLKLNDEQSQISKDKVGGIFSELLQENYEQFSKNIEENLKNNLN